MSIIPASTPGHGVRRRRRSRGDRNARHARALTGYSASTSTPAGGDDWMAVAQACGVARPSGIPDDAAGLLAAAGRDLAEAMRILGEPADHIDDVLTASTDPGHRPEELRQTAERIETLLRHRREELADQEASPLSIAFREAHAALRWAQLHLDAAEILLGRIDTTTTEATADQAPPN